MAYPLRRWPNLINLQEDSDSEDSDTQSGYHTPAEYVEELCLCPGLCPLCEDSDSEEEIWILYDDSNRNPGLMATIMPIAIAIWTFFWILDAYGLL